MARGKKARRPPKLENLLAKVHECIESGNYLDTRHSSDRQNERLITRPEILQALRKGHRVPSRDRYEEVYEDWSYAIEGKTIDNRSLRVIVAFDEKTRTLIVTAVDLDAS